jgi:hypothetical protein
MELSIIEKRILAGLYLSKYDSLGLRMLGFRSFKEAYNVIGYALQGKPQSVKNYRDEFDPLFPNARKGWHKRKTRDYCLRVFSRFSDLELEPFTRLIESFFADSLAVGDLEPPVKEGEDGASAFAQRLTTGLAAEEYFTSVYGELAEFQGYRLENTTRYGCGYDFRLSGDSRAEGFLAVEVKGLTQRTGNVAMTTKEYAIASALEDRFFLFVVRNFRETPTHEIFKNPLSSRLKFKKLERVITQVSWLTTV